MIINPIIPIWLMAVICVGIILLKRKGIWPFIRQILIAILLFVINLRIMVPGSVEHVQKQEMNAYVLFVVDDTISMLANDYDDGRPRLAGVREDCSYIMDKLPGARFAVISFNNSASLLSPFTDNTEYVNSTIESMYPLDTLYARGTSMNISKSMMMHVLQELNEKRDMKASVFFISDGENTDNSRLDSFAEAAEYIDGGAVLGYGSEAGGNMYVRSFDGELELVEDTSDYPFKPAVSRIDEDNLEKLAQDMGIKYINRNKGQKIDDVLDNIKKNAVTNNKEINVREESGRTEDAVDIYYFFVIPLLILLGFEAATMIRSKKTWRKE